MITLWNEMQWNDEKDEVNIKSKNHSVVGGRRGGSFKMNKTVFILAFFCSLQQNINAINVKMHRHTEEKIERKFQNDDNDEGIHLETCQYFVF